MARAHALYEHERRNPTPIATITQHWGFSSPKTGPATVAVAALKKFGLLEDQGSGEDRVGTLTALALEIVLNPDEAAVQKAIRTAALTPPIHRELLEQYPERLPSDGSLRYELVRNREFTESGASDFLSQLRATIAFAKLDSPGLIEDKNQGEDSEDDGGGGNRVDDQGQHEDRIQPRRREQRAGVLSISLPLPAFGPDEPVVIEFPGKLPEQDWDFFLALVTAMKAGVVESTPADRHDNDG